MRESQHDGDNVTLGKQGVCLTLIQWTAFQRVNNPSDSRRGDEVIGAPSAWGDQKRVSARSGSMGGWPHFFVTAADKRGDEDALGATPASLIFSFEN